LSKQSAGVGFGKTGLSLLITSVILVVLGVFGTMGRRSDGVGAVADRAGVGRGLFSSEGGEVYVNPLDPVPKAEWEVLTGCRLVETPTNAAHHFRVQRDKPMVFRLYFVEAPEVTDPDEDEVAEQVRYFGWPAKWEAGEASDRLSVLGQEAWQAVEALLSERPFVILTKFELRRETHHFYALVVFEDVDGKRRTLQEWLVERGYAVITRPALGWLPIQVSTEQFIERMEGLEHVAQREKRGGWGVLQAR